MHGVYCKTKTFPLKCKYCQQQIFFFSCDCGSRVLFDELGPPWPMHYCGTPNPNPAPYQPSNVGAPSGVNIYRRSHYSSGLLPGLQSAADFIAPDVVKRVKESQNMARDTFPIEPIGSTNAEIIGIVRELSRPNLARRHGLDRNSVGFSQLADIIGDADPVQLTVQVDELPNNPGAIDYSGYTFLSPRNPDARNLTRGAVISASLTPQETLSGIKFWLARKIEIIIP